MLCTNRNKLKVDWINGHGMHGVLAQECWFNDLSTFRSTAAATLLPPYLDMHPWLGIVSVFLITVTSLFFEIVDFLLPTKFSWYNLSCLFFLDSWIFWSWLDSLILLYQKFVLNQFSRGIFSWLCINSCFILDADISVFMLEGNRFDSPPMIRSLLKDIFLVYNILTAFVISLIAGSYNLSDGRG